MCNLLWVTYPYGYQNQQTVTCNYTYLSATLCVKFITEHVKHCASVFLLLMLDCPKFVLGQYILMLF